MERWRRWRLEAEGIGFAFHVVELSPKPLTQVGEVEKVRGWEVEKLRDQMMRRAHVGLAGDEQSLSISIRLSVSIRCPCLTLTLPSSNS